MHLLNCNFNTSYVVIKPDDYSALPKLSAFQYILCCY